jgi:EpsD family peptidyl-prolyl cis-trans isomerase
MTANINFLVLLAALAAVLGACGRSGADDAGGQVLAKVNGSRIVAPQSTNVLEQLIDEEVVVQRALKDGLERDPEVMQAIERSRRQTLVRAYIDRAAAVRPEDAKEIAAFYAEHPALFARRRIYNLRELAVAAPPERLAALQEVASRAQSMNEVARWLNAQQLPFQAEAASKSAEHIPLRMLNRLVELRDGQIVVVEGGAGISIVQVVHSDAAPMSEAQAAPIIARYLANRRWLEVSRSEVAKLRAEAKIEYSPRFIPLRAGLP